MKRSVAASVSLLFLGFVSTITAAGAAEPTAARLNWYRGNTHTHTINSDGNTSPDVVARWYKEHGYQFLFITDHEFITDPAPLNALLGATERFLLLPGQEITQWSAEKTHDAAHVNSLFARKVIFPVGTRKCSGSGCGAIADANVPLATTFKANINAVREQGAIPQVNHPNYHWSVKPEDLYDIPDHTLLEIWNGLDIINNLGGDSGCSCDSRPSAEGYWDILLSRGKIIYGVGSDDAHDFSATAESSGESSGKAWVVVRAPELTPGTIEAAIRAGNFYASTGITLDDVAVIPAKAGTQLEKPTQPATAAGAVLRITINPGRDPERGPRYLTRFIGNNGATLAQSPGLEPTYTIKGNEGYVRASITDSNGRRAWTQPIFTDARARQ